MVKGGEAKQVRVYKLNIGMVIIPGIQLRGPVIHDIFNLYILISSTTLSIRTTKKRHCSRIEVQQLKTDNLNK